MADAPELVGEGVVLRAWRPDEAERYISLRDDEILRWTTEDPHLSIDDARAAIAGAVDDPSVIPFAIVDASTSQPVGNLPIVSSEEGTAVVAYWLAAAARGRGLLSAALATVLGWLESHGVERFELEVHPDNRASIRSAERAGFRRVGVRASDASCAGDDGTVVVYERLVAR